MRLFELANIATTHARNAFAEELYLRTGKDLTKPVAVYGLINEICNYKCRYCQWWRMPEYRPEMSIPEWKKALADLKELIGGSYHVEFSGGEPYLKKGFLELLQFCKEEDIKWGVTTNGSAYLSDHMVRSTLAAGPFNINISIDSKRPDVHDYSRGIEGSLDRIVRGIANVVEERRRAGLDFPIVIKPVVHKLNFRYLPEMVDWIQEIGASAINFQPVDRWTEETYNELWVDDRSDLEDLAKVGQELLAMKRRGAPILNSELTLSVWGQHFLEQKAAAEYLPCRVGMRNFFIRPDGEVEVCWHFRSIGNVRTATAREVWYSEEAKKVRAETVACDSLCLFTCLSQKTLVDKVKMGLVLITGGASQKTA